MEKGDIMSDRERGKLWLGVLGVLAMAVVAQASILDGYPIAETAGAGDNTAYVALSFSDGADYVFAVNFDGSTTGDVIHHLLDDETGLDVDFQDYGWGEFVNGFGYDGHSDIGYGGGEDWWHYWISDDAETWESPLYGIADRTVVDGSIDGWRYGGAGVPIPEPMTATLIGLGGLLVARRRRA